MFLLYTPENVRKHLVFKIFGGKNAELNTEMRKIRMQLVVYFREWRYAYETVFVK